ncbi:unnamed protein product [Prorocentrum cordatum]|uniref:Uncharacterized protein n=1 Tax=Prorocentrum cordatum TaxID=2364126 RepID=A0ABN9Q231_9DINO|nr:unnamed protein product [Polarella glacialis]
MLFIGIAGDDASTRHFLWALFLGMCLGLPYMVFDYCPMCLEFNRRSALTKNDKTMTICQGAKGAIWNRIVTTKWEDWREECTWQTLYFSVGTWFCMWMMWR